MCPRTSSNFTCKTEDKKCCLVKEIKVPWANTGFTEMTDQSILKKVQKLHAEYSNLRKTAKKKIQEFNAKKNKLFDIASSDLVKNIMTDKKRSKESKKADLAFLEDQIGDRKFGQ